MIMRQPRIIPCLLVHGNRLVKTIKFRDPVYVGDPVNTVRIFSEKEADEIAIFDITASLNNIEPNYRLIEEMAGEAFMPVSYGGGVKNVEQIRRLIRSGVEKVVINSQATESIDVIKEAVEIFGSQAIVGGIDVRRRWLGGFTIVAKSGSEDTSLKLNLHIQKLLTAGVGELFINDIDRDGTMTGYDLKLLQSVTTATVPVVVCGGAGKFEDFRLAVERGGASAVAAGSLFVFYGKHRAVLITYPKPEEIKGIFKYD
jgi:cyclase